MPADDELAKAIAALQAGIDKGVLSAAAEKHAHQLVDRLQTRVQVAVIGPAEAGKTDLLQVFLGKSDIEDTDCHYSSNSNARPLLPRIKVAPGPARILDTLDLIHLSGFPHDQGAVHQALNLADMVLWCTQSFSNAEAKLWSDAPDHLKDHSFLVLTKADELARQGVLQERIAQLSAVAQEEFHSLFPTTTSAAKAELATSGTLSETTYAASGAQALAEAVSKLASDGRRADLDSALLFITRHGLQAMQASPSQEMVNEPSPCHATYDTALQILRTQMLKVTLSENDPFDADIEKLLQQCSAVSDDLVELATDSGLDMNNDNQTWCDDLLAAADKIMLMSMENTLTAAADAVGILAQLSLEMESRKFH